MVNNIVFSWPKPVLFLKKNPWVFSGGSPVAGDGFFSGGEGS